MRRAIVALVGALAASAAFAAPAPVAEAIGPPRLLLDVEVREETFGTGLCCPQHALAYAGVELISDGRLRAAVFGPPGTLDLAGPPTVSVYLGQLDVPKLHRVVQLLGETRIGQHEDCHAHTAFLFFASASTQSQRLTWHGRGTRTHELELTAGPDCDPALIEVVAILRDAFRALVEAPR
jgi:hypothetical protein